MKEKANKPSFEMDTTLKSLIDHVKNGTVIIHVVDSQVIKVDTTEFSNDDLNEGMYGSYS